MSQSEPHSFGTSSHSHMVHPTLTTLYRHSSCMTPMVCAHLSHLACTLPWLTLDATCRVALPSLPESGTMCVTELAKLVKQGADEMRSLVEFADEVMHSLDMDGDMMITKYSTASSVGTPKSHAVLYSHREPPPLRTERSLVPRWPRIAHSWRRSMPASPPSQYVHAPRPLGLLCTLQATR